MWHSYGPGDIAVVDVRKTWNWGEPVEKLRLGAAVSWRFSLPDAQDVKVVVAKRDGKYVGAFVSNGAYMTEDDWDKRSVTAKRSAFDLGEMVPIPREVFFAEKQRREIILK